MNYHPIYDKDRSVVGIVGVAIDITEQNRLESALTEAYSHLAERQRMEQLLSEIAQVVRSESPPSEKSYKVKLSEEEISLMRLVVTGKTNVAISEALNISERTVRYKLRSIYDKLGISTRAQAIHLMTELGLLYD